MQTTFEKLGVTYRQEGDYLLPNIEAPESPQIGIWGQRRLQYLRTSKKVLYTIFWLSVAAQIICNLIAEQPFLPQHFPIIMHINATR